MRLRARERYELRSNDNQTTGANALRTNLNVPFADRLIVRALGARWDPALKTWYCPDGTDLTPLLAWLPVDTSKMTKKNRKKLERVLNGSSHTNADRRSLIGQEGVKNTTPRGSHVKLK